MSYKLRNKIIGFGALFLLIGCEPMKLPDVICGDLAPCDNIWGPNYYIQSGTTSFFSPVFNPNNPDEILYVRIHSGSIESLELHNIASGTTQVILSEGELESNNIRLGRVNWSVSGWIVFENMENFQIYKMQSDGSQIQQLTTDGTSHYPNFTNDGSKIFFGNHSSLDQYLGIIMDATSNQFLDTITETNMMSGYMAPTSLSNGSLICAKSDDSIRAIQENNLQLVDKFKPNFIMPDPNTISCIRTIGANTNEVLIVTALHGIFKLNLTTHNVQLIKSSCENRVVQSMAVSADGSKVIYDISLLDAPDDPCNIRVRSEIHIMNIDGSNDQALCLP
jgi:hypothetical protein